jgi:hypothetical protein
MLMLLGIAAPTGTCCGSVDCITVIVTEEAGFTVTDCEVVSVLPVASVTVRVTVKDFAFGAVNVACCPSAFCPSLVVHA